MWCTQYRLPLPYRHDHQRNKTVPFTDDEMETEPRRANSSVSWWARNWLHKTCYVQPISYNWFSLCMTRPSSFLQVFRNILWKRMHEFVQTYMDVWARMRFLKPPHPYRQTHLQLEKKYKAERCPTPTFGSQERLSSTELVQGPVVVISDRCKAK
jgi:hypothetical protein